MSDDGDETIDADPEDLAALKKRAEELLAQRSAAQDPPLQVWQGDEDAEPTDATVDATVDATLDTDAPLRDGDNFTAPSQAPMNEAVVVARLDDPGDDESDAEDLTVNRDASSVRPTDSAAMSKLDASEAPTSKRAARELVRESQERSAEIDQPTDAAEPKKRRSGLWIALAVILGAQIVAGGVYVALNALRDDGEFEPDIEEVVTEAEPTETALEPTPEPAATPTPAPTPAGTPTPVPPTPTWLPVDNGPRSAPFTFFVEAIVNEPGFFDEPQGDPVEVAIDGRPVPLANPLASGEPLVLRAVDGEPGDEWVQVQLPGDARVAWVRGEEFVWGSTTVLLQIDVSTNSLRVFDENDEVFQAAIATGIRDRPTPQLSTYVVEEVASVSDGGPGRIRLAGFGDRRALSDGLGSLVIEPTQDNEQLRADAGYTTDGRIVLSPNDYSQVAALVAPGAKVEIVGVPAVPTPTPLPEPTRTAIDTSQGGFIGCPPATEGTPPNCYRVVERTEVLGQCSGRQVLIDGDCLLLGGNPEASGGGTNCTANAPLEIGGLCYLRVGPLPKVAGPCPDGARDVGGECRLPVS